LGGLVGNLVGLAWQPVGAGNSAANFSLAASITIVCLARRAPRPLSVAALIALGADIVLLVLADIDSAAALAGVFAALLMTRWWPE
jgi:hypothetical protein